MRRHGLVDLQAEFELELVEGGLDLFGLAAALVDGRDAFLEIHAGLDGAEHFVAGTKNTFEEFEFLGQKFEDPLVGGVFAIQKIHHHHVVLLAIAMATADALLDALRVPGQVVIHHQGAELEIDALRARLGGDHDAALLAEIVHQCRAHIGGARAGHPVRAFMARQPSRCRSASSARRYSSR